MQQATREDGGGSGSRKDFPSNRSEGNFSRYSNPVSKASSPLPSTIHENEGAKQLRTMRRSSDVYDVSQMKKISEELQNGHRQNFPQPQQQMPSKRPPGMSKFPSKPATGVKRTVSTPVRRSSSVEDVNAIQKKELAMRRSRKNVPSAKGRKPMQFFMRRYTDEDEQDLVKQQTSKTRELQSASMKRTPDDKSGNAKPDASSVLPERAEKRPSMTTVHEDFLLQCRNIASQARQLTKQDSDKQMTTEEIEKSMIRYSKGRRHHAGEALHRPHSEQELMQIAASKSGGGSRLSGVDLRNGVGSGSSGPSGNAQWGAPEEARKLPSGTENPFLAKWRNPFSGNKTAEQEQQQPPGVAGMPSSAARASPNLGNIKPMARKPGRSSSVGGVSDKLSNMKLN